MTTADATIAQLKHETKALLEAVNTGQRLRITRRGRPVAWLIPHTAAQPEPMGEQAAAQLEAQGISTAVINPRWIKPLDTALIEFFARSVDVICTIEDHVLHNGFGCSIMEHLSTQRITTPVVRIGWPDQFVEHGAPDILRKKHGLTVENTVKTILAALPAKAGAKSVA